MLLINCSVSHYSYALRFHIEHNLQFATNKFYPRALIHMHVMPNSSFPFDVYPCQCCTTQIHLPTNLFPIFTIFFFLSSSSSHPFYQSIIRLFFLRHRETIGTSQCSVWPCLASLVWLTNQGNLAHHSRASLTPPWPLPTIPSLITPCQVPVSRS